MTEAVVANRRRVASLRHTFITCAILLGIAALGFASSRSVAAGNIAAHGIALYAPLFVTEWLLFLFVARGIQRGGCKLTALIAEGWTARSILTDIVVGAALLGIWTGVEYLWAMFAPGALGRTAGQVLHPQTPLEIGVWIALSLSAGFVEELTFRGYLQRQFGALLANPFLGLLLQAVLFGVSHGYQGIEPVLRITLFALVFGAVALIRRSTRPGMIAHAGVDILGGLLS